MLFEVAMVLTLIVANGFFAGAEIAVVTVRRSRLQQLAGEGNRAATAVIALRNRPERFLATVQIGITLVSATAAAFGGASIAQRFEPVLVDAGLDMSVAEPLALGVVVVVVSYLSIVLGELVPKSLALRGAERYALAIGRIMLGLSYLAKPFVWLLTASSNLILKPFGDHTNFSEARVSAEELQQMMEEATTAGELDSRTGEMASRAIDFGDLAVADVMVPWNRVRSVAVNAPLAEIRKAFIEGAHARMPVHDGTRDKVVGYLTVRDVLAAYQDAGPDQPSVERQVVPRPAHFVPESARAVQVFQEMQHRHIRLAIVVDEHGAVAGLVTLLDLLEEVVGELFSEDDSPDIGIQRETDGSARIRGDVPVRDVNRALDLELDASLANTIAGLCIALAGGIPTKGKRVTAPDGTIIEVLEASPNLVRVVRVTPRPGAKVPLPAAEG